MKRILSVLTLVVYCTQMAVSCGYALDEPEGPGAEGTTHARLMGDQELPTPQDVLVRSELDGDGLVPGAVSGSFGVSQDGAATYHVPLWVPPGRAGVQPTLALNYNSRGGNGLLGMGWSLSGLSQIVRCNKTTVQDGAPGPVRFDATDALCLDGKRLLQVGNTLAGEKTYTTEMEEFSHVVARQEDALGPLWFEVQLKSGMVLEYGREGASRIEGYRQRFDAATSAATDARVVGNHASQSVRYGWSLSRVRDRQGNYMLVEYELRVHGDVDAGFAYEQLPVAMRYTGSTTDASVATPRRTVRFYYRPTERADRIERYVAGFKLVNVRLLSSVELWGPGWSTGALRRYGFTYLNNSVSGRSLLEKLEECDANGDCKRPTVFTWELGTPGTGRASTAPGDDPYYQRVQVSSALPIIAGSVGYPYFDDEGFASGRDFWTLQTLDVNGDGRDDVLYRFSALEGGRLQPPKWYLRLNTNGRDFGPATELASLPRGRSGDGVDDLRTVDLNNDGKVDVIGLSLPDAQTVTNGSYRFFLSNGTGFTETQNDTFDFWFNQTTPARAVPAMHVADLDGNGLPDVMRSLSRGTSGSPFPYEWGARMTQVDAQGTPVFPAAHQRAGVGAGLDHAGYAVDVDGDGAMELLVREPDSATADDYSRFLVALGRTSSGAIGKKLTTTLSTLPVPFSTYTNYIYRQHWFMDINGDGLPDSVSAKRQPLGSEAGNLEISINTGNGFSPPVTQILPAGAEVSFSRLDAQHRFTDVGVRVMDFNLDGKQDLLLTDSGFGVATRNTHVVLESTGTGFVARPLTIPIGWTTGRGNVFSTSADDSAKRSLKGSGWGMKFTQLLDANGDGLTDIIQVEQGELVLYLRNAYRPDMLKEVADGLHNHAYVSYEATSYASPGWPASRYTPATCVYPQSCNMRGQWLVTSHVELGWQQAYRSFQYTYEGGRTDLLGRGWLGFSKRTVDDVAASSQTTSLYHNDRRTQGFYLEAHRPYEETTKVVMAPGVEDSFKRSFEFASRSTAGGRGIFAYVSKVTESEQNGSYGTLRYQESTSQYDDYGNLSLREEVAQDGTRVATSTTYDNFPVQGDHLLGLPRRQTVTSTTPSGQSVTRTKEYQYCDGASCQPVSNLPRRVLVEPDATSPERDDVWLESVFTYNGLGLVTEVVSTDAAGRKRRTELHYDAYERLLLAARIAWPTGELTGPALRTDYAYQRGLGLLTLQQSPNGAQTRWYYDAFARPRAEDGPDAADATLSYSVEDRLPLVTMREVDLSTCGANAYGRNFATCTPNGTESQVRYDALGREFLRRTRGFNGQWMVVDTVYDGLGRVEKVSMPHTEVGPVLNRRFEYDKRGRLRFVYNPDGSYQEKRYEGLKTLHWDEKRNQGFTVEDGLGRVLQSANVTSTGTLLTQYEYGPFGLPRLITDASGNQTVLEYDRLGRRTLLNDPDSGIRRTAYTALGDLRWQTDGNGNTVTRTYDGVGRTLTETNQPAAVGSPAQVTTFVWDSAANGLGALHTATSPDGVVQTYEYDTLTRPVHERWNIQGQEYRLSRTYDTLGRLQTVGYPEVAGRTRMGVLYNYTAQGQVQSVQNVNTGHTYWTATARNASGMLTGEVFGNGVASTRRYDALNQLRFIESSGPTGPVQRLAYDYEANGNLRSRVDRLEQVTEDFQYDGVDRLTQWKVSKGCNNAVFQYNYDALGNLKYRSSKLGNTSTAPFEEATYVYGDGPAGPHAVTSVGADHYAYDGNGNLNQRQLGAGGLRTLEYTYFNLPKKVTEGPKQWTYGYDAGQQRAFKQSNDGYRTVYVGGVYEKRTKPDNTTAHIFHVAGPEEVVAQVEWTDVPTPGTETVAYLHTDHLGSVESVTGGGGAVVAHHKYDPFGLRKNPSNPALPFTGSATSLRLGFTGHEEDDELGLINMKGRMYDPKLGRFLSPDPFVQAPFFGQSLNRYSYVLNNPLSFRDPTGFQAEESGAYPIMELRQVYEPRVTEIEFTDDIIEGTRPEPEFNDPPTEFWQSGPGMGVEPVVGAADPNGSRVSGWEAGAYGAAGVLVGAGTGLATTYALGVLSAVCLPCAVGVGVGLLAYGAYQLATGGAQALWDSGERIVEGRGTASDYFGVGAVVGGVASGRFSKPAFATGQTHGLWAATRVRAAVSSARAATLSTGARILKGWDYEGAEAAYNTIRQTDDVAQISANTGMRASWVARIKDHLFSKTHALDDGVRRFDADPEIANAWSRLQSGSHTGKDLQLLKHELFESRFEGIFRTNYRTAHGAANRAGYTSGLE